MSATLIRVLEGPVYGPDDGVLIPQGSWGVMRVPKLPDDNAPDADLEPGVVVAVCRTEQEAERKAREILFPETPREPVDPLDSLPDDDDEFMDSDVPFWETTDSADDDAG